MPNIYCRSCGAGTKYLYEKPENCPSCAKAYAQPLVIPPAKVAKAKRVVEEVDEDEEDEELYEDYDIEQTVYTSKNRRKVKNVLANVKVQVDGVQTFKLGEIIGSDPDGEKFDRAGMTQEEYKKRIFESKPISID